MVVPRPTCVWPSMAVKLPALRDGLPLARFLTERIRDKENYVC